MLNDNSHMLYALMIKESVVFLSVSGALFSNLDYYSLLVVGCFALICMHRDPFSFVLCNCLEMTLVFCKACLVHTFY